MTDLVDNARLCTSHEHAVVSFLKPLHLSFQLHNTDIGSLLTTTASAAATSILLHTHARLMALMPNEQ